tara:strand:- start:1641 stop:3395 length:1755 start_codon:yes stop_codon:yes gene_type:complete
MYDNIYSNSFLLNFLISFIFLLLNFLFSFSLSSISRNKNIKISQEFETIIIFYLVFFVYAFIFNILILFNKYQYFNEIFYIIFLAQLIFIFKNLGFLKDLNKNIKKNNSNIEKILFAFCLLFFLISILPITDADSIAFHQNLASRIYLYGLSEFNLYKEIEFTLLSNTEIILIFSSLFNSDNFGSQLNWITLMFFVFYSLKKHKNFLFILFSCPLIIFFISTQKLQLFFGLLYLILFILVHKNLLKTKLEFFIFVILLVFYSSGKMSYVLITAPLYIYFLYKNLNKFKLLIIYSLIAFLIVYLPLLLNKQIYFGNMLAPFFDDKIGNSRDMFKALALSIKSSEGWLFDYNNFKVYFRPFLPTATDQLSSSLGLIFFLMLINVNLLKQTKFLPLIIIFLIFATGQFLPRYYFEAFLIMAYFYNSKNIYAKFFIFSQISAILIFSIFYIYTSYFVTGVIKDKYPYMERFSYSFLNSKEYKNLDIKENILVINQDRSSLFLKDNIYDARPINNLNLLNKSRAKNLIQYINNNSIKYIIADDVKRLPKCLLTKKIDEIYTKQAIRNFLVEENKKKRIVFKITKNNCIN